MIRLLLALVVCLAIGAPAEAQIYSWRNADGALVYSDRPRAGSETVTTFPVSRAAGVRATRPAAPGTTYHFDDIIERQTAASGLSPDLIRAVIQVESGFNPGAVSPKGAQGLMQLMPATARALGVVDPFHPEDNIRGGVAYLKQLLGLYSQDIRLALAAYNAGPGSVTRYGDVPPYRETQAYVRRVTSASGGPAATPVDSGRVAGLLIYKWIEVVDDRPVPRYSNVPPAGLAFELVRAR